MEPTIQFNYNYFLDISTHYAWNDIYISFGQILHPTDLSILYLHDLITQYFYILMYVTG